MYLFSCFSKPIVIESDTAARKTFERSFWEGKQLVKNVHKSIIDARFHKVNYSYYEMQMKYFMNDDEGT